MYSLTEYSADTADELSLIAQHTSHPVIRRDIARLLAADQAVVAK
jgi:hypothetical protein